PSRLRAAASASPNSSPGMNRATLRRTNLYRAARSRNQLFREAHNKAPRIVPGMGSGSQDEKLPAARRQGVACVAGA
ncbi:MAG TPA: hypothetical protein VGW37_08440, partial [Terriglobia bacterium]|nr:hypothetical protein [Terriglobia bacterium]